MTEEAARNELAAVRLFLGIPEGESVLGYLRRGRRDPCSIPGCVRIAGHPSFHCTSDQIAKREDGR